jgi:nucleotide-binding universal stress UspA family protein
MSTIIVGVDESQGSIDAIALASRLAGITGSELMLVNVFPYDVHPSRAANRSFEEYLRRDSNDLLERRRSSLGDQTVAIRAIPDVSSARGLHELAEQENAGLVVVGSTHTGRAGRVLPGSTAERLLHGSPCPVAVAPKGYAQRSSDELAVIGCGYDASLSAAHALETAHRLAMTTGARLRVIRVFKPLAFDTPPDSVLMGGMASYNDTLHERASRELESAIATIDAERGVEAEFTVGDPEQLLAEASEQLDLLVVGSRGYGPMHAVMVGGVAGRLVREAACPVIVVPRGAGHTESDSLFAKTAVATHA